MLQQPSEFIMYQKLPLDLNMHSADVSNLQPDFKDIGLQLQAQKAVATQAFFFDAYSVKAVVPSATAPPMGAGIQGMCDLPIQAMYTHPIQAMYDPIRHHHQQHHLQQQQQQQHHHHHHHHQQQQQQQQQLQQHHHHQQQFQHPSFTSTAGMLSTGWQHQQQQESRGSWFPNWQEVFHGFVVGKDGQQEKQSMPPSLEQKPLLHQGVIVAPPVAASRATINAGETQQQFVYSGAQALDPCPLSPPCSHRAATLLPYPAPEVEKKRDDNVIIVPPLAATVAAASDAEARQPRVDSDGAQSIDPSSPLPSCSHSATALLPYPAPEPGENNLVPCTDLKNPQSPPPIDAIACRYTTQSPSWLPQGWITEVQTRRSGTTAGTRDKYYKDLVSGRRFRSRNEVIHFLQTGKGRLRKRRRKKAIASSAFGGPHNLLSHQPHSLAQNATASPCLFLSPQPIGFLLGPLVNSHPVHTALNGNVPSVPGSAVEEVEPPCQTPAVHPTTSSMPAAMLGLKQPIEVRPQKLPVQRKAKTLSPKKCEDKQASRLWQWLQKPVARTMEQPQRQDADKQVNNDGKNAEDLVREPGIARRTAQLGKEIEVAQKTVMHLGKEMQATVEKLTREIQTAQRDLRLEMQATHGSDDAISNVIQAAQRLDSAMGNVTQATQNLVVAMGIAVQAAQLSDSTAVAASPSKRPQGPVASLIQEVPRSDVAMAHSASRGYTTQAVERPDLVMGYSTHAAKQPQVAVASGVQEAPRPDVAMTHSATGGFTSQAVERPDLAMGYFMQAHRMLNGVMGYATEAAQRPDLARGHITQLNGYVPEVAQRPDIAGCHITQPVQMPDVTMHYTFQGAQMPEGAMRNPAKAPQIPLVVMSSAWTQAAQRIDVATGIVGVPDASPLNMGELSRDMHAYQKAVEMSKQIVEARSMHITYKKFAALNPKLDLSMLSPSLSSRQRAKIVQKMKAKHARGLLVVLGRKLCLKALRKTAVRML